MKKNLCLFVTALTLIVAFTQCQPRPVEATFDIVRDVREWGTAVSAVVIDLGGRNIGTIDTNTFSVYATTTNPISGEIIADNEPRIITSVEVNGSLITLNLDVRLRNFEDAGLQGPTPNTFLSAYPADAAIVFTNGTNLLLGLDYTVVFNGTNVDFSATQRNIVTPIFDDFVLTQNPVEGFQDENYRIFIPEGAQNLPIVLWNHGGGETYRFVDGVGNEGAQLYANMGGVGWILNAPESAVILAPQRGVAEGAPGYSRPGVIAFIEYLVNNGIVDRSRIYMSGPSAGGHETLALMQEFPHIWAAAVPICCGAITEENAVRATSGGFPIWLTGALNCGHLHAPAMRLSYERLLAAGATVYLTVWDGVFGTEHSNYNGHWSWIQVLNNEVHEDVNAVLRAPIMNWLFEQVKTTETVFSFLE